MPPALVNVTVFIDKRTSSKKLGVFILKNLKTNIPITMKNILFILLFFPLWGLSQTKSIQKSPPLTTAAPESVGMSSERLARIDAMCKQAVVKGEIPGAVVLVARKGKVVYHKAFGQADSKTNRALQTNDIFRIASQTTAAYSTASKCRRRRSTEQNCLVEHE